jgi:segregation and condensation protein B
MENISAVIEALILASESPLALEKICSVLTGVDKTEIKEALEKLITGYEERQSGICVQEVAGGFQFRTRPEHSVWVKKLKGTKPASLSPAALETLAIVAYRQPIVKMEIESIRGVDVSAPLKGLLEKKLIRIVGRKDVPGKPIIYGTTKKFLEVFNLKELADLPTMREMKELTLQQEVYEQEAIDFDDVLQEAPDKESFILDEVRQGEPQTPQKTAETKEAINQEPFEPEIIEDETTS